MMATFTLHKVTGKGRSQFRMEGSTATCVTGPKMWEGGKAPKTIEVKADGLATPKIASAPKPKAKPPAKKVNRA